MRFIFLTAILSLSLSVQAEDHGDALSGFTSERVDVRSVSGQVFLPAQPKPAPRAVRSSSGSTRRRNLNDYSGYAMRKSASNAQVRTVSGRQVRNFEVPQVATINLGGGIAPTATNTSAPTSKPGLKAEGPAGGGDPAQLKFTASISAMHIGTTSDGAKGGSATPTAANQGGGGYPQEQPPMNQQQPPGGNNGGGDSTPGGSTTNPAPKPFANSTQGLDQALSILDFQSRPQSTNGRNFLPDLPEGQRPTEANRASYAALVADQLSRSGLGVQGISIGPRGETGKMYLVASFPDGTRRIFDPLNPRQPVTIPQGHVEGTPFAFSRQQVDDAIVALPGLNRRLNANYDLFPALNGRGVFTNLDPQLGALTHAGAELTRMGINDPAQLTRTRLTVANHMIQRGYPLQGQSQTNLLSSLDDAAIISGGDPARLTANVTELQQQITAVGALRAAGMNPSAMQPAALTESIAAVRSFESDISELSYYSVEQQRQIIQQRISDRRPPVPPATPSS